MEDQFIDTYFKDNPEEGEVTSTAEVFSLYQRWKDGNLSFWPLFQFYLDRGEANSCIRAINEFETDLIVPRETLVSHFYPRIWELAYSHDEWAILRWLRGERNYHRHIPNSYQSLINVYDDVVDSSSVIETLINRRVLMLLESEVIFAKKDIMEDNVERFKERVESEDKHASIICYMAGLSGKDEFIEIGMNHVPEATIIGMAEMGNPKLVYFDLSEDQRELAYKRLLLYDHEKLFLMLDHLYEDGYNSILTYGSRHLIYFRVDRDLDTSTCNSETYVSFMERFHKEEYESLCVDMRKVRTRMPDDIDVLFTMKESNRYKVYLYLIEPSVFFDESVRSIEVAKIIYDIGESEIASIPRRLSAIGLSMNDLLLLIPNNNQLSIIRWMIRAIHHGILILLLILLLVLYRYILPYSVFIGLIVLPFAVISMLLIIQMERKLGGRK